jgi:hypothetical protein
VGKKIGINTTWARQPTDSKISFAIVVHIGAIQGCGGLQEFVTLRA